MEAHAAVAGLGIAAAFGCGASACSLIASQGRCRPGFSGVGGTVRAGRLARWLRNGVRWAKPAARFLLRRPGAMALTREAVRLADARGHSTSEEALLSCAGAVLVLVAALVGLASASALCGLAVSVCIGACTVFWLRGAQERRREALGAQVPDALRSMGVCFQAGLSLLQTFQQVASEVSEPLRSLFSHAAHRLETGQSAERALEALREGSSVGELAFIAVALDVQHQAGGSLKHVLDAAQETVEGEIGLRRSLRVQTAQAKLSARVVSALPFVLIALFSLVSEGFLEPFFASPLGVALLLVALAMQAAGILAVRRMLDVEVG